MAEWPVLDSSQHTGPVDVKVLIESDVPELVFATYDEQDYLGVYSEEFLGGVARWIYTPISKEERSGMLAGVTNVHDCFRRDVLVVDRAGQFSRIFTVDGNLLHLDHLPEPDTFLPSWIQGKEN